MTLEEVIEKAQDEILTGLLSYVRTAREFNILDFRVNESVPQKSSQQWGDLCTWAKEILEYPSFAEKRMHAESVGLKVETCVYFELKVDVKVGCLMGQQTLCGGLPPEATHDPK